MAGHKNGSTIPYGIVISPVEVGAIVRGKRRQLGMTQVEAASLAGVGTRFLSELERGKPTCELGRVLQVLTRMGIQVALAPRSGR